MARSKISLVFCLSKPMKLHKPNFPALWSLRIHMILIFTITLLCLQPASPANETDHLALLTFKASVTYDPNWISSSRNDSTHFSNWRGITCDRGHQRVTALELEEHQLHGTITPYIGNLIFLKTINIRTKNFNGEIPIEVWSFEKLINFHNWTQWTKRYDPFLPLQYHLSMSLHYQVTNSKASFHQT